MAFESCLCVSSASILVAIILFIKLSVLFIQLTHVVKDIYPAATMLLSIGIKNARSITIIWGFGSPEE